jgi:hypothetical protein
LLLKLLATLATQWPKLKEAVAMEDSINDFSQKPYPAIPANELCGKLLLQLNRPTEASTYFQKALLRKLRVTARQPA